MLLLDNDVLIKCSCYALLTKIQRSSDAPDGILGAAPYVVRHHLAKSGRVQDREGARQRFEKYLETAAILEPTDAEAKLSADIEEAATKLGAQLDTGESQLCAIAILRGSYMLLTGDKRAIQGAEQIHRTVRSFTKLRGRLVCLEQAIAGIATRVGPDEVRILICAEPAIDKSLAICFSCASNTAIGFDLTGLASYVSDMRKHAPTMLYPATYL